MSYALLARVQGMIATITIDASSVPTSTQATQMIDDVSDEIDAVLGGVGVSVPVTAPSWFLNRLALLNSYGAAAMILKSAYPEASGPGENPAYAFWESRYKEGLKAIRSGQDVPASLITSGENQGMQPSSYFTRNPDEEEELGDLEGASLFKIGQVF